MLPSIWRPTKCDLQRGRKVAARNASTTTATTAMNPTSKRLDQLGSWAAVLSGCAVTRSLPGSRRRLRARSRRFATYSIAEHRNLVRDAIPGLEDADAGDDIPLASLASRWPCEPGEDSVGRIGIDPACCQRLWRVAGRASPERTVWTHGLGEDRAVSGSRRRAEPGFARLEPAAGQ